MNILFIARFAFSDFGGVGRVTNTLAEEFENRGHNCAFLAACREHEVDKRKVPQFFLPSERITSKVNREFLSNLISRMEISVIVNQSGTHSETVNLIGSVKTKVIVISVHHGCVDRLQDNHASFVDLFFDKYNIPQFLRLPLFYRLLKKRSRRKLGSAFRKAILKSDKLILLSDQLVKELAKCVPNLDMEQVSSIPNPAPFLPCLSGIPEKENVLLYVGKISVLGKRVDRLLEIWSLIQEKSPNWRLEIVGDGPDKEHLERWASDHSLERVTFHGQGDPAKSYRKSRILVMTSDFESFGMVLLEAQAFGCVPVALASLSSVAEIIEPDITGVVVREDTATEFASKLHELMMNKERIVRMAYASAHSSERFSRKHVAETWLELFGAVQAKSGEYM